MNKEVDPYDMLELHFMQAMEENQWAIIFINSLKISLKMRLFW
jgi:hypothetical protein